MSVQAPMNLGQVRVIDPILTTVALGYQPPQNVGNYLFPRVPVQVSGGQVLEFGKEAFVLYNSRRAPGAATKRIDFGYAGKPFALVPDSLEGKVPREYLRDAAKVPGINLGSRAVRVVLNAMLLGLENDQAQLARTAANYAAGSTVALAPGSRWSDAGTTPTVDVLNGMEVVRETIGMYPNTAIISPKAFKALQTNASITDRFKYTSHESITTVMLQGLWDLERVFVGKAIYADPNGGAMTDVWGTDVVLAYVPLQASSLEEPSYGYTYAMDGNPMVEQPYYDNNPKSWIYPVTYERAPVLSGIAAGYLIQTASS